MNGREAPAKGSVCYRDISDAKPVRTISGSEIQLRLWLVGLATGKRRAWAIPIPMSKSAPLSKPARALSKSARAFANLQSNDVTVITDLQNASYTRGRA